MGIIVDKVDKKFGHQMALKGVSFEARDNEILGLLGPNGAGKSTLLRIITCYLPPTAGRITVNGYDVMDQSEKVLGITGYLPENNPLYHDQYVHEYLRFVGRLNGLKGNKLRERIGEMIDICGLKKEQNKEIGKLSKGYRQRVGLAQTLIHDPDVLILDEPTTGLDPNQISEFRNLIKEISPTKTVILSSHIMQEVQAICDRVVIINEGKIVADSTLSDLLKTSKKQKKIRIQLSEDIEQTIIESIPGVGSVENVAPNTWVVVAQGKHDIRPDLMKVISDRDLNLLQLSEMEDSLEEIFKLLTTDSKD